MPQIDFYILNQEKPEARYPFVCRIIEKAYAKKHHVYIHTETDAEARRIDDLLWTYKDNSFIPHELIGTDTNPHASVRIGSTVQPEGDDILINLAFEVPEGYQAFQRVIEIVPADANWKTKSREHFRRYRSDGFELNTHNIA